jgi:hypothetical protein
VPKRVAKQRFSAKKYAKMWQKSGKNKKRTNMNNLPVGLNPGPSSCKTSALPLSYQLLMKNSGLNSLFKKIFFDTCKKKIFINFLLPFSDSNFFIKRLGTNCYQKTLIKYLLLMRLIELNRQKTLQEQVLSVTDLVF